MAFRRNQVVLYDVADGRAVLIDGQGSELIELNPVATAVWEALDGQRSVDAIAAELANRFPGAEPGVVRADVATFISELRGLGLVEEAPLGSAADGASLQ